MNDWAAALNKGSGFLGIAGLPSGLPIWPVEISGNIVRNLATRIKLWNDQTFAEFEQRRRQPGYITNPVPPPMSDARPGIAFIQPVLEGPIAEMSRWPTVTFTGPGHVAHVRRLRNAYRDPTNYGEGPVSVMARSGPTSTFGRGTGIGVNKWGDPLPFMNRQREKNVHIKYTVPADDLLTVRRTSIAHKRVRFAPKAVKVH